MADAAELKKLDDTLGFFKKYYEFDAAIKVHKENKEYLKKFIHDKYYVENRYELRKKKKISTLVGLGVAFVAAIITIIAFGIKNIGAVSIGVGVAIGVALFCGIFFITRAIFNKQVNQKWAEQREANDGITAQIEDVTRRCDALEKQRRDYLPGLDEKGLVVIPSKYIIEAEKIASYVRDGKAETAEQAIKMYEDEQVQLKEKALLERKRKDAEIAERNRKLEEQRLARQAAAEKEAAARERAERLNAMPLFAEKKQPSGLSMSNSEESKSKSAFETLAKGSGLSLSMLGKKQTPTEKPAVKVEKSEEPIEQPTVKAESVSVSTEEVKAPVVTETAAPKAEEVHDEPKGLGLALSGKRSAASSATANKPVKSDKAVSPKSDNAAKSYAVIGEDAGKVKLVDEPDEAPQKKDAETLSLETRMNSILSMSKGTPGKHGKASPAKAQPKQEPAPKVEAKPAPQKFDVDPDLPPEAIFDAPKTPRSSGLAMAPKKKK